MAAMAVFDQDGPDFGFEELGLLGRWLGCGQCPRQQPAGQGKLEREKDRSTWHRDPGKQAGAVSVGSSYVKPQQGIGATL
jgi:hypothetical protein